MKLRAIISILSLLTVLSTATGGYLYYSALKKAAAEKVETQGVWYTEATRDLLDHRISTSLGAVKDLSGRKGIQRALLDPNHAALEDANRILDSFNAAFGGDVSYLLDHEGNAIASSNRRNSDSFVGRNYSFRPYFQEAIQGAPSIYMALGVTSGKRGVYYGHKVDREGQDTPSGVVVMKSSVEKLEEELLRVRLRPTGTITLITGPDGLIFMSDDDKYLFQVLEKISDEKMIAILASKQFGEKPLKWSGFESKGKPRMVDAAGNDHIMTRQTLPSLPGWHVVHLQNMNEVIKGIYAPLSGNLGVLVFALSLFIGMSVVMLYRIAQADISRRKAAEAALRKSENRYRRLTENSKDMISRMSLPDGRYEFVNHASMDLFGYSPGEFYNSPHLISKIIHPDCHAYFNEQWTLLLEGKLPHSYEYQIIHKSGETRWINQRGVLIRDDDGKIVAIESIATDISEKKKGEIKLQRTKDALSAILESTADGIFVENEEGKSIFYNERFKELWNLSEDAIKSADDENLLGPVLDQLHHPEAFVAKVQELYHTTKEDLDTLYFIDGRIFERYSRPLLQSGKIAGRVWSFRDVTDKKRSEKEREKLILDLQNALKEVKTLRGILPICSFCKKIRDDKGYWNQIESYIHAHSEAEFTHGICRECAKKHYPGIDIYDD